MRDRPILMHARAVRGILDDRKTQTRRPVKWLRGHMFDGPRRALSPNYRSKGDFVTFSEPYTKLTGQQVWFYGWGNTQWLVPPAAIGDWLYVRETWCEADALCHGHERESACVVGYRADQSALDFECDPPYAPETDMWNWGHSSVRWRPSIHMPQWAARIWLEVTDVRCERVGDISDVDAIAEGVTGWDAAGLTPKHMFGPLWRDTYGDRAPWPDTWVWVILFRVLSTSGMPD